MLHAKDNIFASISNKDTLVLIYSVYSLLSILKETSPRIIKDL